MMGYARPTWEKIKFIAGAKACSALFQNSGISFIVIEYVEEKMKTPSAVALVMLFLALPIFSQTQTDRDASKRDVFVILDISGSMTQQNKFTNVQDYLNREVINGLLKNGDTFTLITFGDSAAERFSRSISSDADKAALLSDLRAIRADNDYTDIGMAMEKLSEVLEKREESGVRRIILFITDGLNAPPPGSRYSGINLALDERFKSLGEKIARSGWFLYVIGIGGNTDAQAIAGAVPGSTFQTTDSELGGLDVDSYVGQVDEDARAREAALTAQEEARKSEEDARLREEALNRGFMGFLRRLAAGLGIPLEALFAAFAVLIILIIVIILLLKHIFRTLEILITDEKDTLIKKLAPFGFVLLNSLADILPAIGNENNLVLRIERSAFGLKVKILDSAAIADTSPYKKGGTSKLKGVINLANGRIVKVTVR
jgi:hypothetical protein